MTPEDSPHKTINPADPYSPCAKDCPICSEAEADSPKPIGETRFDEFDDDNHPFRQWWVKHGQFMMAGGGRKESIWSARGWIAREQLGFGREVTGESMHEERADSPKPVSNLLPICRAIVKYVRDAEEMDYEKLAQTVNKMLARARQGEE